MEQQMHDAAIKVHISEDKSLRWSHQRRAGFTRSSVLESYMRLKRTWKYCARIFITNRAE
jgi:hypothetical protein